MRVKELCCLICDHWYHATRQRCPVCGGTQHREGARRVHTNHRGVALARGIARPVEQMIAMDAGIEQPGV